MHNTINNITIVNMNNNDSSNITARAAALRTPRRAAPRSGRSPASWRKKCKD